MVFGCFRPKDTLDDESRMVTSSAQAPMSSKKQARSEASCQKAQEVDRLLRSANRKSKPFKAAEPGLASNKMTGGEGASAERKKSHQSRSISRSRSLQANQTTGGSTDVKLLKTIRSLPSTSQPSIISAYHLDRPRSSDDFRREIAEALARGKLALARVQSLLDRPAYADIREQYDDASVTQASCRKVEAWMDAINSAMASPQKESKSDKAPWGEWSQKAERGVGEGRLQEGWAPPIMLEPGWERGGYPIFHVDWAKLEGEVKQARETRWQEELDDGRGLAQAPLRIITADELKLDVRLAPIRTRSNSSTSSTVRSASSGSNGSSMPSCTSDREASSGHNNAPLQSLKPDRGLPFELPISSVLEAKQCPAHRPEQSFASLNLEAAASRSKEASTVAENKEVTSKQARSALPVKMSPTGIVKSPFSSTFNQEILISKPSEEMPSEFEGRDPLPSIDEFLRRQATKGRRKKSSAWEEGLCLPYVARARRTQYDQRRRTLESFLQSSGLGVSDTEVESATVKRPSVEPEDIYAKFTAKRAAFEGLKSPDSILVREVSPASSGGTSDGHVSEWSAELKANGSLGASKIWR